MLLDFEGEEFEIDEVEEFSTPNAEQAPPQAALPQFVEGFVISKRGANVRAEPTTESEIVASVGYRANIMVSKSEVEGWAAVTYKTYAGFMADSLISSERPPELVKKTIKPKRALPTGKRAKAKLRPVGQTGSGVSAALAISNSFSNAKKASGQAIDRARAEASRAVLGGLAT